MTSPFMETMTSLLNTRAIRVTRLHFAYMTEVVQTGRRRPPPPVGQLAETFSEFAQAFAHSLPSGCKLFIGGKSMGGRIATMIADDLSNNDVCRGVVCLGYPFHPVNKPERLRTGHLQTLKTPTLIVQGERDSLGTPEEIKTYNLAKSITCKFIGDGDHDLKPRKSSGLTHAANMETAADYVARWMFRQSPAR